MFAASVKLSPATTRFNSIGYFDAFFFKSLPRYLRDLAYWISFGNSSPTSSCPDLILPVRPRGVHWEICRPADDSNGRCNHCERTREKGRASARHLGLKPTVPALPRKTIVFFTIVHRHDLTPLHASTARSPMHSPIHNGLTQGKTRTPSSQFTLREGIKRCYTRNASADNANTFAA